MKYSIINKSNPKFTGKDGADVAFVDGKGETDSKWIANWYKGRGYEVNEVQEEAAPTEDEKPKAKK